MANITIQRPYHVFVMEGTIDNQKLHKLIQIHGNVLLVPMIQKSSQQVEQHVLAPKKDSILMWPRTNAYVLLAKNIVHFKRNVGQSQLVKKTRNTMIL